MVQCYFWYTLYRLWRHLVVSILRQVAHDDQLCFGILLERVLVSRCTQCLEILQFSLEALLHCSSQTKQKRAQKEQKKNREDSPCLWRAGPLLEVFARDDPARQSLYTLVQGIEKAVLATKYKKPGVSQDMVPLRTSKCNGRPKQKKTRERT